MDIYIDRERQTDRQTNRETKRDNGLNESSLYQVGACLQVESCHKDWIPHISVGSKINKLGFAKRVGFIISQLDLRTTSWVLYLRVGSLLFSWC